MTAEQYLLEYVSGECPPEFVYGELVYRSPPEWPHGRTHAVLAARMHTAGFAAIELHLRVSADVIRIADIAVFSDPPAEEIPSSPPWVIAEIISPDDRPEEMLRKLEDYRTWGVEHIWVVEPGLKKFHVYDQRGLVEVQQFELPGKALRIDAAALFTEANAR